MKNLGGYFAGSTSDSIASTSSLSAGRFAHFAKSMMRTMNDPAVASQKAPFQVSPAAVVVNASATPLGLSGASSGDRPRASVHVPRQRACASERAVNDERDRGRHQLTHAVASVAPSRHDRRASAPSNRVVAVHAHRASRSRQSARRTQTPTHSEDTASTHRTRLRSGALRHRPHRRRRTLATLRHRGQRLTRPTVSTLYCR